MTWLEMALLPVSVPAGAGVILAYWALVVMGVIGAVMATGLMAVSLSVWAFDAATEAWRKLDFQGAGR